MAASLQLEVLEDDGSVSLVFGLTEPSLVLGRDSDNDLVLDRESVSGTHARVTRDADGEWWIEDLDSTNGIWQNDTQLDTRHRLSAGEQIEIGVVKVRVAEAAPPAPPEPPAEPPAPPEPPAEPPEPPAPPAEPEPPDPTDPSDQTDRSDQTDPTDPSDPADPADPPPPAPRGGGGNLERALDRVMQWMALVHGFLACWLPRIIGGAVRGFCRLPMSARFSVGFGVLALLSALAGWWTLPRYFLRREVEAEDLKALRSAGFVALHGRLILMWKISAGLSVGAALWAWVRKGRALFVFKAVLAWYVLAWIYVFHFFTRVPGWLHDRDYKAFGKHLRNEFWITEWTPWTLMLIVPALLGLGVALRSARNHYRREEKEDPLTGDEVVESLRTGGRDPRMRSSSYWATFGFFLLLAYPFLLSTCGWEKPYGLPKGSGEPVVEMVKVQKKKKKPKQKMIVNNWSPYIFERMEIDDLKVLEDLDEMSMDTYEIQQEKSGKLGRGGGKKGGWPEGMEGTSVRFIRLEYAGGDWDQDMGKGADYNLLLRFNQITGFPIANDTESRKASRLRLFPKGRKPPFVYLTGKGSIRFTSKEIKTLRWYTLEEGGLLFIDDGGPGFRRQVDSLMRRLYPGNRFVDIPNDDPIFRAPFVFPSGAPPLWGHGGKRAKGIRHQGRWVVFYHPGDMGDAWQTGHSGVAPEIAEQAYRMGINVMYYAFNMYYARHFE